MLPCGNHVTVVTIVTMITGINKWHAKNYIGPNVILIECQITHITQPNFKHLSGTRHSLCHTQYSNLSNAAETTKPQGPVTQL